MLHKKIGALVLAALALLGSIGALAAYGASFEPEQALGENNAALAAAGIDGVFTLAGMPESAVQAVRGIRWQRVSGTQGSLARYDMGKDHTYKAIVRWMAALTNNGTVNVELYRSSLATAGGRSMYYIVVGRRENAATGKINPNILVEANIHARETGASNILIQQLDDLVHDALRSAANQAALEKFYVAAMVVSNPDGYEGVADGALGANAKTNGRGVNLNRNFPSSNASQKLHTQTNRETRGVTERGDYYPGPYLGSEAETKNLMSFTMRELNEKTLAVLSYHQVGREVYGGKLFQSLETQRASLTLNKLLRAHTGYAFRPEEPELTLFDHNGSYTDWVSDLAAGREYGAEYGRWGTPLICTSPSLETIRAAVGAGQTFGCGIATLEIGYNSSRNRNQRANQRAEYEYARFDSLFPMLIRAYTGVEYAP